MTDEENKILAKHRRAKKGRREAVLKNALPDSWENVDILDWWTGLGGAERAAIPLSEFEREYEDGAVYMDPRVEDGGAL